MKIIADIDIDVFDRDAVLQHITHIPASLLKDDKLSMHPVGFYLQDMPIDPITSLSSIPYKEAEERGYFKFDLLNVNAYGLGQVKDETHLKELMDKEPIWEMLEHEEITQSLFQLKNELTHDVLKTYKPKSVIELAICAAMIRPGKRHLIGKDWDEIEEEIWEPVEGKYWWRKSHAISYAIAIIVQMNLLIEESS